MVRVAGGVHCLFTRTPYVVEEDSGSPSRRHSSLRDLLWCGSARPALAPSVMKSKPKGDSKTGRRNSSVLGSPPGIWRENALETWKGFRSYTHLGRRACLSACLTAIYSRLHLPAAVLLSPGMVGQSTDVLTRRRGFGPQEI